MQSPQLRRLSKKLWTDHELFEWGTERFASLQLNAMSGRPAGQYYVTLEEESIPINERAAVVARSIADTTSADGNDRSPQLSPQLHAWQKEHGKAVRAGGRATRRSYR